MAIKYKDRINASIYLSNSQNSVLEKVKMQEVIKKAAHIGEIAVYVGSEPKYSENTCKKLTTYRVIGDEMGYTIGRFKRRSIKSGVSIAAIRKKVNNKLEKITQK